MIQCNPKTHTSTEPRLCLLCGPDVLDSQWRKSTRPSLYPAGIFPRPLLVWPPIISGLLAGFLANRCWPRDHKTRSLTFQASSWSQVGCLYQADPAPSSSIWVLQACSLLALECDGTLSSRHYLWPSAPSQSQARKSCIAQMHPSDPLAF